MRKPSATRPRRSVVEILESRTLLTATPTVSIAPASALAGSPIVFTVSLSAAESTPVTGAYGVTTGTADLNDYNTEANGSFTIAAGATSTTLSVATYGDQAQPSSEYFIMVLSNLSSNAVFASGGSTEQNGGTILSTVGATASTTTLTVNSLTANTGGSVTLTANVAGPAGGANPTGMLYFLEDGNDIGATQTLVNGTATLTTPALTAGSHTFTAQYDGDPTYARNNSNPAVVQVGAATAATASIALSSDVTTAAVEQAVTLTAVVSHGSGATATPTGTVNFYSGGTFLQGVTLNNGVATYTTTTLPTGVQNITAYYVGSDVAGAAVTANYLSCSSAIVPVTVGAMQSTSTALSISPASTYSGTTVQILADVTPAFTTDLPLTGTVSFYIGGVLFDTEPVVNNLYASAFSSTLPVGVSSITAVYSGDTNFAGSTSAVETATITGASTTLTPSIGHVVVTKSAIIGQKYAATVPVTITNFGTTAVSDLTVNLLVGTSSEFDQSSAVVATQSNVKLLHGRAKLVFHVKSLPSTLTTGQYFFIAQVSDAEGDSNAQGLATPFIAATPTFGLSATVGAVTPSSLTAKKAGTLVVTLLNTGNVDLTSPITVTLNPSTDGATALPITLATATKPKIKAGKKVIVRLHFKPPAELTAGSYFATVSVTSNQASASAVTSGTFSIS